MKFGLAFIAASLATIGTPSLAAGTRRAAEITAAAAEDARARVLELETASGLGYLLNKLLVFLGFGSSQPPSTIAQVSVNETNISSTRTTPQQRKGCISTSTYEEIDSDIEKLKNAAPDDAARSHFLGGLLRLVAHDFMDFDRNNATHRMGPDGCFEPNEEINAGLSEGIWCDSDSESECPLTTLYKNKYPNLSKADFWIASANAVIRQTSVDNGLDMMSTFQWGRVDADSCSGSALRLPSAKGCTQVEDVFVKRMGLTWRQAAALLGAHTLGSGHRRFSGHEGTWSRNIDEAQIFDTAYYKEFFRSFWVPRNIGTATQDWTTVDGDNRLMLNSDLCLAVPFPEGHPRSEALEAILEFLGGSLFSSSDDQMPFYTAFWEAWTQATTNGQENLSPLADNCD